MAAKARSWACCRLTRPFVQPTVKPDPSVGGVDIFNKSRIDVFLFPSRWARSRGGQR
jgi:hypothetical protein